MGRVFTRKLGEGRSKLRRHDGFAKALVLELPLLHQWQHETATRSAAAALLEVREPRFLVAHGLTRGRPVKACALIRLSLSLQGSRLVSLVRPPAFLEGAVLDCGPGTRTRHNRNI